MGGIIWNPDKVEIKKRQLYNEIIEYSVEEPYYFESCGTSYGNHIFGRIELDNYYSIKKKEKNGTIHKEL